MNKKLKYLITAYILLCFAINSHSQKATTKTSTDSEKILSSNIDTDTTQEKTNSLHGFVAASTIATSNQQVPLWMRSMLNGGTPLSGLSASIFTGINRSYDPQRENKLFDWAAGIDLRGNAGNELELYLIEAYAKTRLGIFQLSAGRTKDFMGLADSTLSTGAFSMSGNALGIPKIEISTPNYWEIPFTNKLLAFKGNFAHGWMGERISAWTENKYTAYLHQKSLYGRLGKPNWKVRLYGGFNHQVMWTDENEEYEDYGISKWKIYQYVIIGKAYGTNEVPKSKIGNHLGSLDQAIEIKLNKTNIFAYHQFYYEVGAMAKLANIKDGTWGISLKNNAANNNCFNWHKILFEFIYSKSQGGEIGGPSRPSGWEDYYNNWQFIEGWSNNTENIGNILFTSQKYIREDLPQPWRLYIVNNRLTAFHTALDFSLKNWYITSKLTYSINFGNYWNTPMHRGPYDEIVYHDPPYFEKVNQFDGYLEASRNLKKNWIMSLVLAGDYGELLYNSTGGYLKFSKCW